MKIQVSDTCWPAGWWETAQSVGATGPPWPDTHLPMPTPARPTSGRRRALDLGVAQQPGLLAGRGKTVPGEGPAGSSRARNRRAVSWKWLGRSHQERGRPHPQRSFQTRRGASTPAAGRPHPPRGILTCRRRGRPHRRRGASTHTGASSLPPGRRGALEPLEPSGHRPRHTHPALEGKPRH